VVRRRLRRLGRAWRFRRPPTLSKNRDAGRGCQPRPTCVGGELFRWRRSPGAAASGCARPGRGPQAHPGSAEWRAASSARSAARSSGSGHGKAHCHIGVSAPQLALSTFRCPRATQRQPQRWTSGIAFLKLRPLSSGPSLPIFRPPTIASSHPGPGFPRRSVPPPRSPITPGRRTLRVLHKLSRPSPTLIVAAIALFVAIGGGAWAATGSTKSARATNPKASIASREPRGRRGPRGFRGPRGVHRAAWVHGRYRRTRVPPGRPTAS
jgi:hypothetical protein